MGRPPFPSPQSSTLIILTIIHGLAWPSPFPLLPDDIPLTETGLSRVLAAHFPFSPLFVPFLLFSPQDPLAIFRDMLCRPSQN